MSYRERKRGLRGEALEALGGKALGERKGAGRAAGLVDAGLEGTGAVRKEG